MSIKFSAIVLGVGATGLGAVRGLGRKGISTCLIAFGPNEISLESRYPTYKVALVKGNSADKKQDLFNHLDRLSAESVVITTSDWFASVFAEYQEEHDFKFKSCTPSKSLMDLIIDKSLETKALENIIDLPATVQKLPPSPVDLLEELKLPIIFKPRSHEHFKLGQKNIQVKSKVELVKFYDEFRDVLEDNIAQEIIPGGDDALWVCNCTFNYKSKLVSAFVFRRLGLSPPHYGVTSYAVSEKNQRIIDAVQLLGEHLGYIGTAMVEFKYDSRDDSYKYIELNPRLGLCNYFDTRCGINNVFAVYQLAVGGEVAEENQEQIDGVIFASVFEDIYSRKQDGFNLFEILAFYMKDIFKPHVFIYFSFEDIKPGFKMAVRDSRRVLRSLFRKIFK